jgi:small-conductance mechanosensitive channel
MADPFWALESLAKVFPTMEQRVLVTTLTVVGAMLVAVGLRRVRDRFEDRIGGLWADLVTSTVLVLALAAGSVVIVSVWEQTTIVEDLVAEASVGSTVAPRLAISLVVVVVIHVTVRFVGRLLNRLQESSAPLDRHQQEVTYRLSQVSLWGLGVLVVLGIWEFDLSGLLIGAGVLGLVIGMAARQTLRALLAGFVLMLSQPFEVGDWVAVADAEGTVRDISIVDTRIETPDGEYVILPNDEVTATKIVNRSATGQLRIEVEVGVDYEVDLDRAIEVTVDALDSVEDVLQTPSPVVDAKRFDESAIVLGVRFWISNPSPRGRWRTRTEVVGAIKDAFDDAGIAVPFPQRTVSTRQDEVDLDVGGEEAASPSESTDGGAE